MIQIHKRKMTMRTEKISAVLDEKETWEIVYNLFKYSTLEREEGDYDEVLAVGRKVSNGLRASGYEWIRDIIYKKDNELKISRFPNSYSGYTLTQFHDLPKETRGRIYSSLSEDCQALLNEGIEKFIFSSSRL